MRLQNIIRGAVRLTMRLSELADWRDVRGTSLSNAESSASTYHSHFRSHLLANGVTSRKLRGAACFWPRNRKAVVRRKPLSRCLSAWVTRHAQSATDESYWKIGCSNDDRGDRRAPRSSWQEFDLRILRRDVKKSCWIFCLVE